MSLFLASRFLALGSVVASEAARWFATGDDDPHEVTSGEESGYPRKSHALSEAEGLQDGSASCAPEGMYEAIISTNI